MPKPTVLLTESIHSRYLRILERGARVVRPAALDEQTLITTASAEGIAAIVIRTKGGVSAKLIQAAPNLKIIGRHGIGVEHIDIDAATRAGVWVVNTPEGSLNAVAEHTWSMILALAKNAKHGDQAVRAGDFKFRERCKSLELFGKTLGIVGLGRIGTRVAEIACAFGMAVLFNDILPLKAKQRRLPASRVSLRELLKRSDVVSVHTPLDDSTRGLIGARELAWMRSHALLINCARGAIVDTYAAAAALKAGKLGGAGIDVFVPEEPPLDHPLLKCENAILSPHSAAQTPEANLNYGAVVEDVLRVLRGERPHYPLNKPAKQN